MRPVKGDYNDFYQGYIDLIDGEDILYIMNNTNSEIVNTLNSFPQSKGNYRYAEGKWTLKEVIGHMMDVDRVFAFRALSIARGEHNLLPGFDQDEYVRKANFNDRELFDLTYEYRLLREANFLMYRGFDTSVYQNRGNANGSEVTVLAIMFMTVGHQKHHLGVLKERYR